VNKSISLSVIAKTSMLASLLFISACTRLFFQPNQINYLKGVDIPFPIEEVTTITADGHTLTHWLLKPEKTEGVVFYLHGNAQNITAHIRSVAWLVKHGYLVYMFEYRGYITQHKPSVEDTISDVQLALHGLIEKYPELPIYVFGQSLGGSIAITSVAQLKEKEELCALITEAAFASYEGIAKEKLAETWFTGLLKAPLSRLFSSDYDAQKYVSRLSPLPLLIIHSPEDKIVPMRHGTLLYEIAKMPKSYLHSEGVHISTLQNPLYRAKLLEFLKNHQCKALPLSTKTSIK
jgi:fermentation-respiration switch protein FrsA (DUF1100 family)